MRRLIAISAFVAAVVLWTSGTALADPPTGPEAPTFSATGPAPKPTKGNPTPNLQTTPEVICTGGWSPEPQYSATSNNIHWGVRASCIRVYEVTFIEELYTVHGSSYVFQDSITKTVISQYPATPQIPTACYGHANTSWVAAVWITQPDAVWYPYPAWSAPHSYPCGGMPD